MKIRALACIAGVVAGTAALVVACSQPKVDCTVGHAGSGYGYAARYTVKTATPACDAKHFLQKGDVIGLESYHPPRTTADGILQDFSKTTVAIQAGSLGDVLNARAKGPDPSASDKPYAIGSFASTEPGVDGFCTIPTMTPAVQNLPDIPAMTGQGGGMPATPDQPATKIEYAWRNVRVYVTAAAQGTQLSADLTYTRDDCTVTYHVVGMWPAIDCHKLDADGKPLRDAHGAPIPDSSLCNADADPDAGRPLGSGISPDFPVACDPDLLLCMLKAGEPPVLNPP